MFVDSRARAEQLAAELRGRDVETYLSHGSLARAERQRAEEAFANGRDCVIVATSTLELGVDVGDLDRVVQIAAPPTVASFLQRLGRSGRRASATANLLVLSTREDALLQALGVLHAWEAGFVDALHPPALPLHVAVQQLLAVTLQEGGVGHRTWTEWLGRPFVLGSDVAAHLHELTAWLTARGFLFDDNGILGIADVGKRTFGRREFLDLLSVFSAPPTMTVVAGRDEIGMVPIRLLTLSSDAGQRLLLAGRTWRVLDIDWRHLLVRVEPAPDGRRARWFGEPRALSARVCRSIRSVLAGADLRDVTLSRRATGRLGRLRDALWWVGDDDETYLVHEPDGQRLWWTFAGGNANLWLGAALGPLAGGAPAADLSIQVAPHVGAGDVWRRLSSARPDELRLDDRIASGAVDRLKFGEALPGGYARRIIERRLRDDAAVAGALRSAPREVVV